MTDGAQAKVFDLSLNAPIIVAGAGAGGIIYDLEARLAGVLTSPSWQGYATGLYF